MSVCWGGIFRRADRTESLTTDRMIAPHNRDSGMCYSDWYFERRPGRTEHISNSVNFIPLCLRCRV